MSVLTSVGRVVGWLGLTAVGGLHLVWATGSSWPAKNQRELASATVGAKDAMPGAAPTAVVSGAALMAGTVVAGAIGQGTVMVSARRLVGAALLARAAVGGGAAALRVLGLGRPDKRFLRLDSLYYRPFCAILGLAVLIGSRRESR